MRCECNLYLCASVCSPRSSHREFFKAISTARVWLGAHQDLRPVYTARCAG